MGEGFDDGARQRFIKNITGHMKTCRKDEIIKREIAIFREVSDEIATGIEKELGIKGYDGISGLRFNG